MITNSTAAAALRAALGTGGDFAEIFCQDKTSESISLRNGQVESALTQRIHGAGVRVFRDLSCVYVHTSDTSAAGLLRAAQRAADAVGGLPRDAEVNLIGSRIRNIHPVKALPLDVPGARKAALLRGACAAARDTSPAIAYVQTALNCSQEEIQIFNSEGLAV